MSRKKALLNILIYFIFQIIFAMLAGVYYLVNPSIAIMLWITILGNFIIMLLLYLCNKKYVKSSFSLFKAKLIKDAFSWYGIYFVILILFSLLISIIGISIPQSENQLFLEQAMYYAIVPVVVLAVVQAPFMEEMVFRASLVSLFTGKKGYKNILLFKIGILFSFLVFVSIHITSELKSFDSILQILAVAFPYMLLTGMLIGFYDKYKGNVVSSMVLHTIINLVSSVMLIIGILSM